MLGLMPPYLFADLLPHGYCLHWQPALVALHLFSDGGVALAYGIIPALLLYFISRRRDLQFNWVFVLFGAFILACGLTHVMEIVTLWKPWYLAAGLIKAFTALVSLGTAAAIARLMPQLIMIPSASTLAVTVRALEQEVKQRRRVEEELWASHAALEARNREELARAASALDRSEERLRSTFDYAAIGLAHVSPDGRFLQVNQYLCEMLLYSSAELLTKTFAAITDPDYLQDDLAAANRLLAGEVDTYSIEKRYIRSNGEPVWANITVSLMRTATGAPDYFISAIENIEARKAIEQRLTQRDRQLALVFDEGSIGDFTWDIVNDHVQAHRSVWRCYGMEDQPQGMSSQIFVERRHPDDSAYIQSEMAEAMAGRKPLDLEFRVLRPDQSVCWVACRGTVVRNSAGTPVQVVGLNIDVTARKTAEAAVAQSEREFRQLVNVLPQMIWFTKPDGSTEYFNDRWYEYTGTVAQDSLGAGWASVIHEDDIAICLQRWQRATSTGEFYETEYRIRSADGSYRWFLGRGLPVRDDAGTIVRWFGSCTDIDQIKQAESQTRFFNQQLESRVVARTSELVRINEQLAQTQARLQSVLDSATQVAIISIDSQGTIQIFNAGAEQMLRTPASDVIGRATMHRFEREAERLIRARDLSRELGRTVPVEDIYLAANIPEKAATRESVFVLPDGSLVDVVVASAPVFDTAHQRVGSLKIASYIPRRKELEQQLLDQTNRAEAANRAKSEFLAAMSHEIRTPMNAILGMADLLWETELNSLQKEYVERFRRAGGNLLTLINDILDLSKIEAGRFELERIDFDLEDIIERTAELMAAKAHEKKLVLTTRISPTVHTSLVGDPARLQQVLMNLMGNAIKFTHAGEVGLYVKSDPGGVPGRVLFEVRDTGIGIPPEKLEAIFEDFTQADNTITRRFGGTGLGLGIARRLVGHFGGELTVKSVVGKGTSFFFYADFEFSAHPVTAQPQRVLDLAGHRVLIVDNNETNRVIFAEMCSSWGMLPQQVESPLAVSAAILDAQRKGAPFSAIILDRVMPSMDGFELVTQIRTIVPESPIILTTSDDQPGDATRAQSMGLSYARKPLRRAELARLLSTKIHPQMLDSGAVQSAPAGLMRSEIPISSMKIRVLVAEDSEDNRFLIESYLGDSHYQLTLVDNGAEAVRRFQEERFDVVLMDVQMPVMDGLTATAAIRAHERQNALGHTPILALTANALREDFERSAAVGCDGHLAKPITRQTLISALSRYLTRGAKTPVPVEIAEET